MITTCWCVQLSVLVLRLASNVHLLSLTQSANLHPLVALSKELKLQAQLLSCSAHQFARQLDAVRPFSLPHWKQCVFCTRKNHIHSFTELLAMITPSKDGYETKTLHQSLSDVSMSPNNRGT